MLTSLDRPEIMQVHRFMEHTKASCLDLQFILPETATRANDIQKTIIFVNNVTDIMPLISIIQGWMKKKGYLEQSSRWIRPYNATLSDWTKGITSKAFGARQEKNTDCTMLVATDAYGMGIDNPDVKLVVQWDIPMSFDSMIQQMRRAGRKGALSAFVFFMPKWTKIDPDSDEIEKRLALINSSAASAKAANSLQPSNSRAIAKPSPLSQIIDADKDISDSESVAKSVGGSASKSEAGFDLDDADDLISSLMATEADENYIEIKKKSQACRTNVQKRAKLADKIFAYIYIARCCRLFSLEWYDDTTYAPAHDRSKKLLPSNCCNGSGCLSPKSDFLRRKPFIDVTPVKYTKADREWMAYRSKVLKQWRHKTAEARWDAEGIEKDKEMFNSFIMPTACLSALATFGGSLSSRNQLVDFLQEWYGMQKYADKLLICLQKNWPALLNDDAPAAGFELPSKADRKAALKDFWVSNKIKDLVVAEEEKMTEERDEWANEKGRASEAAKTRIARRKKNENKLRKKQGLPAKSQGRGKTQALGRLTLNNSHSQAQYGTFKAILSDPIIPGGDDPSEHQTPLASQTSRVLQTAKLSSNERKKAAARMLAANRLKISKRPRPSTPRPSTPPTTAMELDRPGSKRKVRVTAKGIENTPSKRMHLADD